MYPDPAEVSLWLALMQTLWDPAESSGYTPALTRAPLDGSSDKELLLQVAIGDAQVTTLGAEVMARATRRKNACSDRTRRLGHRNR